MGSIEVYDYKQEKWVPYVPDYEKWYQHFKDLRDGFVTPDYLGRYTVGSGAINRRLKEEEDRRKKEGEERKKMEEEKKRTVLKLVTPVAQGIEIAKSTLKRSRKGVHPGAPKKKKRGQPLKQYRKLEQFDWDADNY